MLAFEISVNGKQLCVVGTKANNVAAVAIDWVRSIRDRPEMLSFHIGGIIAGTGDREHFRFNTPDIKIGDEITVRLLDAESVDEPDRVYQPARNSDAPIPKDAPPL